MESQTEKQDSSIWLYAFGYFACYAPYSALAKLLSKGALPGMVRSVSGFEILPVTTMASLVGMVLFLSAMGWWKHANHRQFLGIRFPFPTRYTFLSGLATAAIIATTTLAYTFEGVSIVLMMLLMRGGVLVMAPLVDLVSRRKVRWFSWAALGLSLAALLAAFSKPGSYVLTLVATLDVTIYLLSYFVRLRFMSRLAKSDQVEQKKRYFVEEQMVATPAIVTFLALFALLGPGSMGTQIRAGFTTFFTSGALLFSILVGLLSQGTGVFGGLILLDKRENTFCVPVNRASSVLAGLLATAALIVFTGAAAMPMSEIVGAGLMIAAIVVLSLPTLLKRRTNRA